MMTRSASWMTVPTLAAAVAALVGGCEARGGGEGDTDAGWSELAVAAGDALGDSDPLAGGDAAPTADGDALDGNDSPDAAGPGDGSDGGDGGGDAVVPALAVVLNEIESDGDDRIEILALGGLPGAHIDLGGWSVHDEAYDPAQPERNADHRYQWLPGTMLASGQRLVLTKGKHHSFGLGKTDQLVLRDPGGVERDATVWSDGQASPSWCRQPDESGPFVHCSAASFGAANGGG